VMGHEMSGMCVSNSKMAGRTGEGTERDSGETTI
jgi:hypothetical protein